jgi:hypothetical protein
MRRLTFGSSLVMQIDQNRRLAAYLCELSGCNKRVDPLARGSRDDNFHASCYY